MYKIYNVAHLIRIIILSNKPVTLASPLSLSCSTANSSQSASDQSCQQNTDNQGVCLMDLAAREVAEQLTRLDAVGSFLKLNSFS